MRIAESIAEASTGEAKDQPDYVVCRLSEAEAQQWDDYVRESPRGTFFHLSGWKRVIQRAFGHSTHYLYLRRRDRIVGVLPMAELRNPIFGSALISLPFCVYGGAVADSEAGAQALENEACALAERLRVDYLELRNLETRKGPWLEKDLYVTFRKSIPGDPELSFDEIPRKQRAMVRKGQKAGLRTSIEPDLHGFYRIYSRSLKNLGTPVFGKRYFQILLEEFGRTTEILTVLKNGRPVSSVMSFYFRDEVLPYYGGGLPLARAIKANDFMYWELMKRAIEREVRVFDFGRSKIGSGSYHFKKHWGFKPEPLAYQYHLVRANAMPDVSPANPKYRFLISVWRRLPLWTTQTIGPLVARYLG